jgi:anti-anti-sigma factor
MAEADWGVPATIHIVVINKGVGVRILGAMLENNPLSYSKSEGTKAGTTIVTLEGPMTIGNMFELQNEFRALKPPCLIVDLTGVPYMDSAGLGVIMNSFVSAQGSGRKVILTGVSDRVRALFEMTKVDLVLQTCDTVEAAEALA